MKNMKIAIVAPNPVPYCYGGAEALLDGLIGYLKENTSHSVELIKLDSLESDFWNLVYNYKQFAELDLSRFDLVLSTKYPAWMVNHPNHICYLLHTLRGLYDTYSFADLPEKVEEYSEELNGVFDLIRSEQYSRNNFFRVLELLEINRELIESLELSVFPGPFIRELIHFFDKCGYVGVKKFFCISETVKGRADYFLESNSPECVYPATYLSGYKCEEFKYFLAVSRLESHKRVYSIIVQFKKSTTDRRLLIVGTGGCEEELKDLAKDDDRIEFLGFVDGEKLLDLYANCLAVIFTPYDEDYGLVTIEAMKSKKPVLTLKDSGGVLEFVDNEKTGFVCEEDDLYEKIDYISEYPDKAKSMGLAACEKVKGISWENVYEKILNSEDCKRKKILVLNTYSVYPVRGGGQLRVWSLYKRLAEKHDVTLLSLVGVDELSDDRFISSGLREVLVKENYEQASKRGDLEGKVGRGLFDLMNIYNSDLNEEYLEQFKKLSRDVDVIVFSHPYMGKLYDLIEDVDNKKIIFGSHNVEYLLKKDIYGDGAVSEEIIEDLKEMEASIAGKSDCITVVSQEHAESYVKDLGISRDKIVIVPNGVDNDLINFTRPDERRALKNRIEIPKEIPVCFFVGSWHQPNIESLKFLLGVAKQLPDVLFFVVGSVCDGLIEELGTREELPKNLKLFAVVNDEIKNKLLSMSDIALNPMFSGSGTNLKIFEYMSAGIPVITTKFGARGMDVQDGKEVFFAENEEEFLEKIRFVVAGLDKLDDLKERARKYVEENFDWDGIAKKLLNLI